MSQNNQSTKQFWSGYALGAISAAFFTFTLGTKAGRSKIKEVIEYIEEKDDPYEVVNTISELLKSFSSGNEILDTQVDNNKSPKKENIESIIHKIRNITTNKKQVNKFIKK